MLPQTNMLNLFVEFRFHCNQLQGLDGVYAVKAFCNTSFSTNTDDVKSVQVVLNDNGKSCFSQCTCTVGLWNDCAHVSALLYVLCEIVVEGPTDLPADQACTDILCPWAEPKGSH